MIFFSKSSISIPTKSTSFYIYYLLSIWYCTRAVGPCFVFFDVLTMAESNKVMVMSNNINPSSNPFISQFNIRRNSQFHQFLNGKCRNKNYFNNPSNHNQRPPFNKNHCQSCDKIELAVSFQQALFLTLFYPSFSLNPLLFFCSLQL